MCSSRATLGRVTGVDIQEAGIAAGSEAAREGRRVELDELEGPEQNPSVQQFLATAENPHARKPPLALRVPHRLASLSLRARSAPRRRRKDPWTRPTRLGLSLTWISFRSMPTQIVGHSQPRTDRGE